MNNASERPEALGQTLSRTAALAQQTFDTWEEATDAVLEILMGLLGMRSVFLTRMDLAAQPPSLRVVAARNLPGEFSIPVGTEAPLQDTA